MPTSYIILALATFALRSKLWRRATACVMLNETIEIILYSKMFSISQFSGTNAYLYYAGKDSLLLLCLIWFCLKKEADAEEPPTEMFLVVFGYMICLNLFLHYSIQLNIYNPIWSNYENIYMGLQLPLCWFLMHGIYDGFNSTERGLYE